uniref:Basement membrane-specific heparan sulfate proteoglycan core protein n=1 Tax=Glossina austeni TaxID=7395 RepID=A0A1A9VWV6_GLOAU
MEFMCENGACIPLESVCDGVRDCARYDDESYGLCNCSSDKFKCVQGGGCVPKTQVCDGKPQCRDGSDEISCLTTVLTPEDCRDDQFFCDDDCHSTSLRCNGHYDCLDRKDEQNCPPGYPFPTRPPPIFPCPQHTCSNGKCFSENERCDGTPQCDDGCAADQFRCRSGECVPAYAQCNGYRECPDNSDEDDCLDPARTCLSSQFRCDNGQCINILARCNGYTDCADSSDEKFCTRPTTASPHQLTLRTYPNNQVIKESREAVFRCRDEGMLRARVRWTRPGDRPLPAGSRDINGRLEIPNIRVEDSDNPRDERIPAACSSTQATCMNSECIDRSQICDGIPHCSDGSDEHSCSHGRKCHPNQFLCRNSKCVDRVWRCDGENDCGDNSDEESCDPEPSGAPCRYDEFQCRSGHCIPKSFQCDDTNDCRDGSDEIGCMAPDKIRDPPPTQVLKQGDFLNITCVGVGIPVPVIVWRLNWGHVPEKCVSKSYAGTGNLYCPDMQSGDSGAYSCEIINTKGSKFTTDTLVTVIPPDRPGVCPAGFFNMLARSPDECINCFCFGVSKTCKSADLFTSVIQAPVSSHRVVDVELSPYSNIVINEAPASGMMSLLHGVQFRASDVHYGGGRSAPYLALPSEYMGNQLKSYGGHLKYDINVVGSGRPTHHPDVIVTGNGFTLTYRARLQPQVNVPNKMEVQFTPGTWKKPDGRLATREEIMMILANVDNLLIRLSYIEATEREVELTNILMNSAGAHDHGLGQASLVEQCQCPNGYAGDSCESCAPGYVRQKGGAWLGRCVPFTPAPCSPGTYGDPLRGIPCRECPCPQTGTNNFANGCSLGPDSEVTCNCHEGYTGRRCENCAPGYQGNPILPGGHCYPVPESTCNAEGTYYPHPNGTCECKQLVVGPRCDTCAPDSFHLNAFTYTGCIECFCSGLTNTCTSSSWYRDQIVSNFGQSRAPHGFTLIRDYDADHPSNVDFVSTGSSLSFSNAPTAEPLYWSLPAQFLGNKISAYGGKLNYTLSYSPMPGGLMSRSTSPDVVIKSGEDLTMIHYRKTGVTPSSSSSYSVPIVESAWQRSDGQVVNRQHLLMALSKIDAIYIKATYTTSTKEGTLTHVSFDIATPTNTGNAKAVEVEECRCPEGYIGLSCERCAPGYKRNPEAGLYLGLCEVCECNGHSQECDAETGICKNCAHNTEGDNCDRCAYGYSGVATTGTPYDCTPGGDYPPPPPPDNQTSCSYCNQAGTTSCDNGYCYCKPNVQGNRCDQCRPGTFGLSERNPDGCKECYCSHKSTTCTSASLYRQLIPVDFFENPPLLTDEEGLIAATENLSHDFGANEYIYSHTSFTPKYWSLRGSVLGNQLYSYGGALSYVLSVDSYGEYVPGNDIILIGNGMKLLWSRPLNEQESSDYSIRLHEEENWHTVQRGVMQRASRTDFMNVLSNLEHLLIRATPKIPTTRTAIRDVILERSVERPMPGSEHAIDVEVCSCPTGYVGSSCESCAAMFYRNNNRDCVPCPCQEEGSTSCNLDDRGYVKCQCKLHYTGDRCQYPDDYEPDRPTSRPSTPPDYDYRTQISVSIAPPEITIIPVGGSITLTCTGRLVWNSSPVIVSWYKLNGQMPYNWEQDNGILHLYDLQIHDSGVYICQARNNDTQRIYEDKVSITITESARRTPAKIENLPPYATFDEYQPNQIDCEVSGNPMPTVIWTRVDGQMSREAHTEESRLIFESPRKSDEGSYRCQANNGVGYEEKYTTLRVRPTRPSPPTPPREVVYIEPPSFNGEPGSYVRLTCQPTTSVVLVYEWNKDGYPIYRTHNLIINANTLEIRESTQRDTGVYTCVGIDYRGRRNYTSDARVIIEEPRPPYDGDGSVGPVEPPLPGTVPPSVKRLPEENLIIQGHDFSITCEASGTPYPSIKWTKVHESLGDNVQQTGSVLRIMNARPDNRGVYLCIAENSAGHDQASTVVDIEPREHPTVDVEPKTPQTITAGGQAMLYCTANGIPEPRVQWRRVDGQPLSSRHQIQNEPGYIIVNDITLTDAGDYECVAENEVGKVTSVTSIRVIVPPIVELEPSLEVLSVTEGDEVKVLCTASGFPNPNVQWVDVDAHPKLATPISEHYNQAYLEFYRVTPQQAKTYKCVATNEGGDDERYVILDVKPRRGDATDDSDVYYPPHQPQPPYQPHPQPPHRQPTHYPPSYPTQPAYPPQSPYHTPTSLPENIYRTKSGEDVQLTCNLTSYGPPVQVRWTRLDGSPLPANSYNDQNTLIITRVTDQNAGKYLCNAYDNHGSVITFHIAELVLVPIPHITLHPRMPIYVTANENVDIYCEVEGEEPIHVSWHAENNRPLPSSVHIEGQHLRFISITPADAGLYYCSASNRYGNTTEKAQVVVNRGHTYEPRPSSRFYELNEGDTVSMTCDAQPSHTPIRGEVMYNWRREDNLPLPQTAQKRGHELLLYQVRKEDEGRYICESFTTGGDVSQPSYAELRISLGARPQHFYPPALHASSTALPRDLSLKLDQQHSKLRVGESTEVECYSSDDTYSDVMWERADGTPLPPHIQQIGNRLVISHVTSVDAGTYVCKCKTDEGDLYTTSYELEIEELMHEWKHPKIEYAKVGSMAKLKCDADNSQASPSYRWSRQYGQMQLGTDILSDKLVLHDVQANDAGTYICTVTDTNGESVDYPTILVVTGAVPQFDQNPLSYMSFPTLRDSFIRFNFDITFRPELPNGLLLFNGQKRGNGDYISLSLKNRYPEFRFDFDGKPMIVQAEHPITLNKWHTVRVNRFRRDGIMHVDDQHPVGFPTLSPSSSLDLIEDLYIGGVPSWDMLPDDAVDHKVGFVGCISRLTLQGSIIELMKEAKVKEGINGCQPCTTNPCSNDGICMESQSEMAYSCICQPGWTGRNCGVEGTQCTPGICGAGRCENTETGLECLCPLNRTGDRCQYIEHLNENSLAFKRNSFAAYGVPRASKLNIKFRVRPNSLDDAVILYTAESEMPSGDYVAVVLRNKHVELIINTGARLKPVVVRSTNPLPLNQWTEIEIARRFGEGILRVGSEPEQKAKATGAARTLYIRTPLYIGGYDNEKITLNYDVNVTQGFDGCISNLYEAQRQLNLIADIREAANIQNCGEINEIDQNETFQTETTHDKHDRVDVAVHKMIIPDEGCDSDPCENGGTCHVVNDTVTCDCGIGFVVILLKFDANFRGNGYLELDRSQFNDETNQKYSFAAMVFSTSDPDGLLLWWGQPKGETYTGQDFMALALVDGIVEFAFRLNGEEAVIRNPDKRVDDGHRHIVLVKRTDNTAILELDHVLYADETRPTGKNTMNLPGHVFIGGAPDLDNFTGGRYKQNFTGCIHVVEGEESGTIELGKVAISGINQLKRNLLFFFYKLFFTTTNNINRKALESKNKRIFPFLFFFFLIKKK